MTTLPEYLQSARALEDVKAAIDPLNKRGDGPCPLPNYTWVAMDPCGDCAWNTIELRHVHAQTGLMAFHLPADPGLHIVTDCGKSISKLMQRRGFIWSSAVEFARNAIEPSLRAFTTGDIGTLAADLPDAICRVMLASHRVANLETK